MTRLAAAAALGIALAGVLACDRPAVRALAAKPASGFEASWRGSDTGRMAGEGVAEWCDFARYALVRATLGDTGIGVLFYPAESLVPGRYDVAPPRAIALMARPSSAVALRWFGSSAVIGFRARTGSVTLGTVRPALSGRFDVTAVATTKPDTITLSGTFREVRLRPAPSTCAGKDTVRR